MLLPLHQRIRERVTQALSSTFGLSTEDVPPIVIQAPPERAYGDLAVPVAFELAKRLRRAPRAIAEDLAKALGPIEGVSRVVAAPTGYLNLYLDRVAFLRSRLAGEAPGALTHEKAVVEHTAINPNKAAHIGHLRNAALGDTLGRLLRYRGRRVEIQNYIDDTGVQVADVVVGFREIQRKELEEVRRIADSSRFDYYCWDLYAAVTEWYEGDQTRLKIRASTLHDIERGGNENARMAAFIADRIVRCHLVTMRRMNVAYDLLTWEGDILRLEFWHHAFESLKARGSIFLRDQGRLAGCWVMPIEGNGGEAGPDDESTDDGTDSREKVLVRSDGTVTYVGKDIANQFWKFGLLGRDFHYRVFDRTSDGRALWATTSSRAQAETQDVPSFGRAHVVYNVIDTRQSYLQKLLKQALDTMGYPEQAERSIHYAYEMVALSHATARDLGYDSREESGRPFVEVSGRKGLGVKADDLLDRLTDAAHAEVVKRNPELPPEDGRRIAEIIATAAVRYFLVKFTRTKVIAFDIAEALSFEGETGPYLQYAAVRANNIFRKLREREGVDVDTFVADLGDTPAEALAHGEGDELWDLVLQAGRLDEMAEQALRTLELSVLAKYAFGLAQQFNGFYHKYPILSEERQDVRRWRAAAVAYFRDQLTRALELMGCQVPSRM